MSDLQQPHWRIRMWGAWCLLAVVCMIYGGFAVAAGLGLAEAGKIRVLPLVFQIHALAGGIVLIVGIIQFNPALRTKLVWAHRWGGRVYVASACLASIAAVINAAFFDVIWSAKLSFALVGIYWLATTLTAFRMIRRGNITRHQEWMIRSFSLSLFFLTFSIWVPLLAESGLDKDVAYVVAVTLSWVLNLATAEISIRRTRLTNQGREADLTQHYVQTKPEKAAGATRATRW